MSTNTASLEMPRFSNTCCTIPTFCTRFDLVKKTDQLGCLKSNCRQLGIHSTLWPGVNFNNVQSAKKDWQLDCRFCVFEICTRRVLMKLTPGVDYTNMITHSCCMRRSQKHKKIMMNWLSFLTILGPARLKAKSEIELSTRVQSYKTFRR